ncbi:MAG TPA: efflux RND transporter periplasmic adaptor subunit [Gemmatimonadaceae bacterium]|nr:efflux RND transporter periplasmic adaptor subunit [Gemmatimonadaceae bacterium]
MSKRPFAPATAVVAALFALAGLAAGCTSGASATTDTTAVAKPKTFSVTPAQRARLSIVTLADTTFRPSLEVTGTVAFNGDHSTQVLAPISGPVTRLLVNTGSEVKPGTPMAAVSSPDFASAVSDYRKAEDAARNAQRILTLDEQLYKNDALARSDLDQARTDASQAAADVDAAVQQLRALGVSDSTIAAMRGGSLTGAVEGMIRAPIAGVVVEKLVNPGQLLQAGSTPTFTVADLSTMWVMASVYPSDLALVHEGETARIYTDASPAPVRGRVDYVAALVDPGTKATAVRIVADNAARLLKRDMFVRVDIESRDARKGIVIPASALLRDEDNLPFVFVAMPDGSFARRRITYGYRVGDSYQVTSGLAAGDKVVADGALFIQFAESQ